MKLMSGLIAAVFAASTMVATAGEKSYDKPSNGQSVTHSGVNSAMHAGSQGVDFTLPVNAILLSQPRQACRYPSNLYRAGDHCFEPIQEVVLEQPKKVEPAPVEPPKAAPVAPPKPENG